MSVFMKYKFRKLYDRMAADYVEAFKKGRAGAVGQLLGLLITLDYNMATDER